MESVFGAQSPAAPEDLRPKKHEVGYDRRDCRDPSV